jgi:hypothetical protein
MGSDDFVLSGAGLWPLLALLASAADEEARAELAEALGRPADTAQQEALELIDVLRTGVSTTAALGLWTRKDIPLHEEWASGFPEGVMGTLTDQAALDQWASDETNGLIDKFPLELTPDILVVLASALAARVKWRKPFDVSPRQDRVSWDDPGEPDQQWLSRTTYKLADAAVLDSVVTRIVVEGDGDATSLDEPSACRIGEPKRADLPHTDIYIHTYIHTYVYIHLHLHLHTYIHTYTYT